MSINTLNYPGRIKKTSFFLLVLHLKNGYWPEYDTTGSQLNYYDVFEGETDVLRQKNGLIWNGSFDKSAD